MRIYHTETQEDYDALMIELESRGAKCRLGGLPTKENYWTMRYTKTCVAVSHQVVEHGSINTYMELFPEIPSRNIERR